MTEDRASEVLKSLEVTFSNLTPGSEVFSTQPERKLKAKQSNVSRVVSFFETEYENIGLSFKKFRLRLAGIEVTESGAILIRSYDKIPDQLTQELNEVYYGYVTFVPRQDHILARVEF